DVPFVQADALHTPFGDAAFDAVVLGYLMRNVGDLDQAIAEQYRILKPGGRVVILETTVPTPNLLSPFIWLHLHVVIPILGRLVTGDREAYRYLPDSTEHFVTAEAFAGRLRAQGFVEVGFRRLMGGTIAIHWGEKPGR
ncbi:methyltransferase domain-containing protein, partial [bacterium]|nr:methyltransferase domain-containing protein [bacterium]